MEKAKEGSATQKIKIERRYGNHCSYFVDANGLLKGEWGGFDELYDYGPNGEAMFELYYSHFSRKIPINEFGFFYNKFSCKKYDGILKLPNCDFYICEKNGRFGLINSDERYILHTAYNNVEPYFWGLHPGYGMRPIHLLNDNLYYCWKDEYKDNIFFIITTETGKFLFNLSKGTESAVYDDIIFADGECHSQIIYKTGDKYGALDVEGNVLLKPYFDCPKFRHSLYYNYHDFVFNVWVENGMLYRKIPAKDYDFCFKVGSEILGDFLGDCFFVTMKCGKYGLLSGKLLHVSEPELDEIIFYKPQHKRSNGSLYIILNIKDFTRTCAIFIIVRKGEMYKLYNVENGHLVIDDCENMTYKNIGRKSDIIEYTKDGIKGFVLWNESIVSTAEYEDINTAADLIIVKKNGKYGVIDPRGNELHPCIYDSIRVSNLGEFTFIKDGKKENINVYSRKISSFPTSYERPTYGRYAGSYAQSEMGWSDEDIDTVLDGDPSAYWNID